jgi:hypothetical protein
MLFWPIIIGALSLLGGSTEPERLPLTKRIDDALADSDAHADMALTELARTEQGQHATAWMTPRLPVAGTTWATLLRDWCIVGNLLGKPSVCARAAEVFPTLATDGPCPADLQPFVGTPEEVAAGIGIRILPGSVDALRESTAGLIGDRCAAP